MRGNWVTVVAVLAAVVGWWGLYELTSRVTPDQQGALVLLFGLLFLAVTATLVPPLAYLNRRFAPDLLARDPGRFFRQSAWGGICVTSWAWLQMHRAFNLGFALITVLIFIVAEVLIARFRGVT
jgi:hypothetical protein